MRVLKFGGTSVADADAFERAVQIVREHTSGPVVVVVSAMSGITDALISANRDVIENHLQRHREVAESLELNSVAECRAMIGTAGREIAILLNTDMAEIKIRDTIAAYGEMLCARLFTMVLDEQGIPASYVDARRCIVTDDHHGNANPLREEVTLRTRLEIAPLLKSGRVPVLGGFIGSTREGVTTTLGRGSSDYSATLIGAALHADEIQIWTDVDGVQTADPKLVAGTRTVPIISYDEAAQLAVLGARVMHAKMIEPVVSRKIPIRIRNSRASEQAGTLICSASESSAGVVKAIAHRMNGTHAVVGCVGDGLSNGSAGAVLVRQVDSSLEWKSTAPSNLVATVERERLPEIVRQIHERLF
ncbi:MAG: aspartate kinase [Acidobacteriota bacterium]|jgi:aspartate kinase